MISKITVNAVQTFALFQSTLKEKAASFERYVIASVRGATAKLDSLVNVIMAAGSRAKEAIFGPDPRKAAQEVRYSQDFLETFGEESQEESLLKGS